MQLCLIATDCLKYRNKIGLDVVIEALRAWRERTKKPNFQTLSKFARIDRVERVMRPYLEALLCTPAFPSHDVGHRSIDATFE
jgi:hypothetical protein